MSSRVTNFFLIGGGGVALTTVFSTETIAGAGAGTRKGTLGATVATGSGEANGARATVAGAAVSVVRLFAFGLAGTVTGFVSFLSSEKSHTNAKPIAPPISKGGAIMPRVKSNGAVCFGFIIFLGVGVLVLNLFESQSLF